MEVIVESHHQRLQIQPVFACEALLTQPVI
jgi:hypothetical protein